LPKILEGQLRPGVFSSLRGGLLLYPARSIEAIFGWASHQHREVEWIDAFYIDERTQPDMQHSAQRERYAAYEEFRAQCLVLAAKLIDEAQRLGKEPMFEVGISD
jgi:hypothetical protein